MLKRQITQTIHRLRKTFPCVAVLGARQAGKSTIMKQLASQDQRWQFYDLEQQSDFATIANDPDLFFRKNPRHIIIDEAQLHPPLFNALRVAIDANREQKGSFLLTGSSSPELLSSITESLAGRVAVLEISPLSFSEIRNVTHPFLLDLFDTSTDIETISSFRPVIDDLELLTTLDQFHFRGGYPEPWSIHDEQFWDDWFDQYNATYVQRDIRNQFPRIDHTRFRRFIDALGHHSGEILNYSNIARLLDVSQPTIKDYLAIAEGTFLWRTLPAFDRNPKKRIIKHPKGHFRDSGLVHHALMLPNQRQMKSHIKLGSTWESTVIEEILGTLHAHGVGHNPYHYRTSGGAEVDLVVEGRFGLLPFEIKYGQTIRPKQWTALKNFLDEYDSKFGFIINNDERIRFYTDRIIGIPFTHLTSDSSTWR